jgi:hypothetical protein
MFLECLLPIPEGYCYFTHFMILEWKTCFVVHFGQIPNKESTSTNIS